MDDTERNSENDRTTGATMLSRRGFFGRAVALAGAAATLLALTGCPGGDQDDDDDDDD